MSRTPDETLQPRLLPRLRDRWRRRTKPVIEILDDRIRVREPHGDVYDVPTAGIGHLEIRHHRDLILGFGHPQHPHLLIPTSRLTAEDRFDQLRQRLEESGHPYSLVEDGVLHHSAAVSLDLLLDPGTALDAVTSGAAHREPHPAGGLRSPQSRSFELEAGEDRLQLVTTPLSKREEQTFCQRLVEGSADERFRILRGRVLSSRGVVVAWFETLRSGAPGPRHTVGFVLHGVDGGTVSYDAVRRTVRAGSVRGILVPAGTGLTLRWDSPVDRRLTTLAFALSRFIELDRSRPTPLRRETSEPATVFRESPLGWIRFVPALLWVLVVGVNSVLLIGTVFLALLLFIPLSLRLAGFLPTSDPRCRRGKRALHLESEALQFCNGLGFHVGPGSLRTVGHVIAGRFFTTVVSGFRGRHRDRTQLLLPPDRRDRLLATLRDLPDHLFTVEGRWDPAPPPAAWDWPDLLVGGRTVQTAEVFCAGGLREQLLVTADRNFEVRSGFGATRVHLSDAAGRVLLFHLRGKVVSWHNGAVLGRTQRTADQVTLETNQGAQLNLRRDGITLDGIRIGQHGTRQGALWFAFDEPIAEALVALVAGLAARFDFYPPLPPEPAEGPRPAAPPAPGSE